MAERLRLDSRFRLRLMGAPIGIEVPTLSEQQQQKVFAVIQKALPRGATLSPEQRVDVLRRAGYARLQFRRLQKGRMTLRFVLWRKEDDEALRKVKRAADIYVEALKECGKSTFRKARFGASDFEDVDYRSALAEAIHTSEIMEQVYDRRPVRSPKNCPDYAFQSFVAELALAWSRATGLPVKRSQNRDRSPVDFVAVVFAIEAEASKVPKEQLEEISGRIDSALRAIRRQK